jgi:hypothetical protein
MALLELQCSHISRVECMRSNRSDQHAILCPDSKINCRALPVSLHYLPRKRDRIRHPAEANVLTDSRAGFGDGLYRLELRYRASHHLQRGLDCSDQIQSMHHHAMQAQLAVACIVSKIYQLVSGSQVIGEDQKGYCNVPMHICNRRSERIMV